MSLFACLKYSSVCFSAFSRKLNLFQTKYLFLNRPNNICRFLKLYNKVDSNKIMDVTNVIQKFEELIPPHLAESWDNTGLLLEPPSCNSVSSILITNDLTEEVLNEALSIKANMIISYHPPIFSAFKSLKKDRWKDRIVMTCIENSIALYSPHTACDAVYEGVNDWLINCFSVTSCNPIIQSIAPESNHSKQIDFCVPVDYDVEHLMRVFPDAKLIQISCTEGLKLLRMMCNKSSLTKFGETISTDKAFSLISVTSCASLPYASCGAGRIGHLNQQITIQEVINLLKNYLQLKHLRVALGTIHKLDSSIRSIAVCAGSGSNVLKDVKADLYVTGEMSHHDLLDANHKGRTVILCEHSNSERGYLKQLANKLMTKLPGINLVISKCDKDPILII